MNPHLHHASESLSCLLNANTHTHTHRLHTMPTTTAQTVWVLRTHCVFDCSTNSLLLSLLSGLQDLNTASNLTRVGLFSFRRYQDHELLKKHTQKHLFTDIFPAGWNSARGADPVNLGLTVKGKKNLGDYKHLPNSMHSSRGRTLIWYLLMFWILLHSILMHTLFQFVKASLELRFVKLSS